MSYLWGFLGQGDIKDVEEALQGTKMTRRFNASVKAIKDHRLLFWQCYGRSISGYDFTLMYSMYAESLEVFACS